MSLCTYPQTLSDVKIGLRLLCNDRRSLYQLAHTKPLYAIVTSTLVADYNDHICEFQFVSHDNGDYITQHHYLYYLSNGLVQFEQIQSAYDLLIITKANPIKLISSR